MLRQLIFTAAVLLSFSANANSEKEDNPISNYINEQVETLELELALFGTPKNNAIVNIASIYVYEPEETIALNFDTERYLPEYFDAKEGMPNINWSAIELYEVEEEIEFNFDVNAYLPKDFNPNKGMLSKNSKTYCSLK